MPVSEKNNAVVAEIERAIAASYPLVYLFTAEESRVIGHLATVAKASGVDLIEWDCAAGFGQSQADSCLDPVAAVQSVANGSESGFYVFKDLSAYLDDPLLIRSLRDTYQQLRGKSDRKLFIISPQLDVPPALLHCLYVIDVPPPDLNELRHLVIAQVDAAGLKALPEDVLEQIALALMGLSLDDSYHLISKILQGGHLSRSLLLQEIQSSKKNLTVGAACLEYVALNRGLDELAGFANFKLWMRDRAAIFNRASVDQGVPLPRGILIMGVSGCGKSLCAKAIPKVWNVPLFRLDMNLIFSGADGNPQQSFHKALQTIESMAPVVLWIDEVENGLGVNNLNDATQSQIFSAFLTWMQEKPPLVFVVATANRIEYLPAEMIRKGRFDQVFFVDLPDESERKEMIALCLKHNGSNPEDFDMARLVSETRGWNGAEIEQVIESARIHKLSEGSDFTTRDVIAQAGRIVPLSQTMSEQIAAQKDWAWDRATPASADNGMSIDIAVD